MSELVKLRVSVARLAQTIFPDGVDGCLPFAHKNYGELVQMAETQERGWNALVAACVDAAEKEPNLS